MPRLLHITDLHFGSLHNKYVDTKPGGEGYSPYLEISPAEAIKIASAHAKPDLLILGGDYVTGKDVQKDYHKTVTVIDDIVKESVSCFQQSGLINPRDRVVVIPGNHDVVRGAKDPLAKFKRAFGSYLTPYTDSNKDTSADSQSLVRRFAPLFVFEQLRLAIYALSTVDLAGKANSHTEQQIKLFDKLPRSAQTSAAGKEMKARLERLLYDDVAAVTASQQNQFANSVGAFEREVPDAAEYFRVVIAHHPFYLTEAVEVKPFSTVLAGGLFVAMARAHGFKLLLHGHTHSKAYVRVSGGEISGGSAVQSGDMSDPSLLLQRRELIQVGSRSAGAAGGSNGIATVDIPGNTAQKPLEITYRIYDAVRKMFVPEHTILIDIYGGGVSSVVDQGSGTDARILLDTDLKRLVASQDVIRGGDVERVEAASYDCALGIEYVRNGELCRLVATQDGPAKVVLEPGERVQFCTAEQLVIPKNMVGHFTVLSRHMKKGLVAGISTHLDPGFEGRIFFPLTNVSSVPISISASEPIVSIELWRLARDVERGYKERHGVRDDFGELRSQET